LIATNVPLTFGATAPPDDVDATSVTASSAKKATVPRMPEL
jgi:hypothetical protein